MRSLTTPIKVLADGASSQGSWVHAKVDSAEMMAQLLKECSAGGMKVIVGSPGSASRSSGENLDVVFVDIGAIDRVTEHSLPDQVISVETGMTIGDLDGLLKRNHQWWPVAAPPHRTIYDVIVSGDGGPLEHGYGGPRHLTLGLNVNLANGTIIKTGGKVVKNVTGYDMTKLIVGSRGILGIPSLAHLRLFARPQSCRSIVVGSDGRLAKLLELSNKFMSSELPMAVLETVERNCLPESFTLTGNGRPDWMADPRHRFLLICQIYENEQVLDEVLPQLEKMIGAELVYAVLDAAGSTQLLQAMVGAPVRYVEIDCAPSAMMRLWHNEPVVSSGQGVSVRPGAGRMRLRIDNESGFTELVSVLKRWCLKHDETMTLASVDGDRFSVVHLPQESDAAVSIIKKIKQQFDPTACFNPLAQLYQSS